MYVAMYVRMHTTPHFRVSEVYILFNSDRDKKCLATDNTILLIRYFKLY